MINKHFIRDCGISDAGISDAGIFDPNVIDRRLKARLSRSDLFALGLSIGLIGIYVYLERYQLYPGYDYNNYIATVHGNFQIYFYAYWSIPLYYLFGWLPHPIGYAIWSLINIFSIFFACRVFGGKPAFALLTYQFIYILFFGQMVGIILGCIALFWWATVHKRWDLAGLGLILAATKFQVGILLGGILWLFAEISWRERIRILLVPVLVFALSLILYPGWLGELYQRILTSPPNDLASISLWRWIGPFALLVFVIPFAIPFLTKEERIIAFFAATALGMPYFQQTDLISLFIFPLSWVTFLGDLGFLFPLFQYGILQFLAVVPLSVFIFLAIRGVNRRRLVRIAIQKPNSPFTKNQPG